MKPANAESRDRQIVVVLRAKRILAAEQLLFDRVAVPAMTGASVQNLRDELPPFRADRSNEVAKRRRAARHDFARSGEQTGKATALVVDVELERLGDEHHRASVRLALSAGKAGSRLLEKIQASATAPSFTDHPEPALVTADIEQRNCLAERAGIGPSRQLGCRRRGKVPMWRSHILF